MNAKTTTTTKAPFTASPSATPFTAKATTTTMAPFATSKSTSAVPFSAHLGEHAPPGVEPLKPLQSQVPARQVFTTTTTTTTTAPPKPEAKHEAKHEESTAKGRMAWAVTERRTERTVGLFGSEAVARQYVNSIVGEDGRVASGYDVEEWPVQKVLEEV